MVMSADSRGSAAGPRALSPLAMPVSIQTRLLLLVLSVLLPGVFGVVWLINSSFDDERESNARALRDSARALSMVVDRELSRRATIVQLLAQSRWLDGPAPPREQDLLNFRQQAQRALQGSDGWIELHAPGRVLIDTRGDGTPPARQAAAELSDAPRVLPLQRVSDPAQAYVALLEPVQRDGRTVYNLLVTIRPAEVQRLVDAQALPKNRIGAVVDVSGHVVARHPGGSRYLGHPITPALRSRLADADEGMLPLVSLENTETMAYFRTSPLGWTSLIAMPRSQFAGPLPGDVLRVAWGALVLLAMAVAGAHWLSRRIVRPVQALKAAAASLQAGRPIDVPASGIVECDEVARALAMAGAAIRHNHAELERRVAEAVNRTREAEQRVAQSQRVEALGRLTGGVAHDFNNLLGVISNSAHLMQRHPAAATDLQAPLAATLRAVAVGSHLTQHLLRFAGRRPTRPQQVELTRYLPEVQELMRSVLGKRVDISVHVAPDTPPVHVEAGELELALINLALNARDAMPSGGELRLRAGKAEPEDTEGLPSAARGYVLITVSDDGSGIPPDVASRVFEPFFTTKAVGKGTGLGLSQVHGFCTQAGGAARLASTPGFGTTVSLLLPASDGCETCPPPHRTTTAPVTGARVLLVEDNDELGDVTAALLRSHGALVQRAGRADDALRLLQAQPLFDVVLTDVVMPDGMDGLALARHLRQHRPALPVVLISGDSAAAAAARDFVVLRKPCTEAELLAALYDAIAVGNTAAVAPAATATAPSGGSAGLTRR